MDREERFSTYGRIVPYQNPFWAMVSKHIFDGIGVDISDLLRHTSEVEWVGKVRETMEAEGWMDNCRGEPEKI